MTTTIQLGEETKKALDVLKVHPRETYDDVLKRLIEHEKLEAKVR